MVVLIYVVAGCLVGVALFAVWIQHHQNVLIFQQGDWSRARWWLQWFGFVHPASARHLHELSIAEFCGETEVAVEMAERILGRAHDLVALNQAVTALINAGRYRRVLELAVPWDTPPSDPAPGIWGLLHVNVAEADYNLGRWNAALARLERMRDACVPLHIVRSGDWQQRAWILAHLGRLDEARTAVEAVDLNELPRIFHPEYYFTRARVAWTAGTLAEASADCEAGLALARRASSVRNGLFMRARIAAASGDTVAALRDFESAAAMSYRAQGGDGLLAWGDLLQSLQRTDDARHAWRLAESRDPESASAHEATARLGA